MLEPPYNVRLDRPTVSAAPDGDGLQTEVCSYPEYGRLIPTLGALSPPEAGPSRTATASRQRSVLRILVYLVIYDSG